MTILRSFLIRVTLYHEGSVFLSLNYLIAPRIVLIQYLLLFFLLMTKLNILEIIWILFGLVICLEINAKHMELLVVIGRYLLLICNFSHQKILSHHLSTIICIFYLSFRSLCDWSLSILQKLATIRYSSFLRNCLRHHLWDYKMLKY